MTNAANLGTTIYQPLGMTTTSKDMAEGDAARATETAIGTTQAAETETEMTTTSDDGAPDGGTAQSYATAREMTEQPSTPTAESIVKALLDSPTALVDQLSKEVGRQDSLSAQAAYKLQALLDAMMSLSQTLEKEAPAAGAEDPSQPATSTETDEVPVL